MFLSMYMCVCVCVQMNRAVNLSFYLDSYNYGLDRTPLQSVEEQNLFTASVSGCGKYCSSSSSSSSSSNSSSNSSGYGRKTW